MEKWLIDAAPTIEKRYPPGFRAHKHLFRQVRNTLLSEELCHEFAAYFEDKTLGELDALAKSFAFSNCKQRGKLNSILQADGKREVV